MVAYAPVTDLSSANQIIGSDNHLFHAHTPVRKVIIQDIHIIRIQPLQAAFHCRHHVVAAQTGPVHIHGHRSTALSSKDNIVADRFDRLSKNGFTGARTAAEIAVSGIDKVDALVLGISHSLDCILFSQLVTKGHGTQAHL